MLDRQLRFQLSFGLFSWLKLAHTLDISPLLVKVDSKVAVLHFVHKGTYHIGAFQMLHNDTIHFTQLDACDVSIANVFREKNRREYNIGLKYFLDDHHGNPLQLSIFLCILI